TPARLWTTTQGTETGTRSIQQDAVESLCIVRIIAHVHTICNRCRPNILIHNTKCLFYKLGAVIGDIVGSERGTASGCKRGQNSGFTAGAGGHVEPCFIGMHTASPYQRSGGQLGTDILDTDSALGYAGNSAGIATGKHGGAWCKRRFRWTILHVWLKITYIVERVEVELWCDIICC